MQQINNNGGTTYGPLLNKDYSGTQNVAIAPFPERSKIIKGKATKKMVLNYCRKNSDLFQNNLALGVWADTKNKKTYFDVTAPIPLEKMEEAKILGKSSNQIAGFNLSDFTEIPLGGTGEFNSTVSPFVERLGNTIRLMG